MKNDNVAAVRNAYAVAERKDLEGWINLFTPDGVFVDNSVGATYRGRALADPVRNYAAFSNMHRELNRIYVDGNVSGATSPSGHPRWPPAASLWQAACYG
jgi:ketosteroid isomerase-like protein